MIKKGTGRGYTGTVLVNKGTGCSKRKSSLWSTCVKFVVNRVVFVSTEIQVVVTGVKVVVNTGTGFGQHGSMLWSTWVYVGVIMCTVCCQHG